MNEVAKYQEHAAAAPRDYSGRVPYEFWETFAGPALPETVGAAELLERDGWPYPVSGSATARNLETLPQRNQRPELELPTVDGVTIIRWF